MKTIRPHDKSSIVPSIEYSANALSEARVPEGVYKSTSPTIDHIYWCVGKNCLLRFDSRIGEITTKGKPLGNKYTQVEDANIVFSIRIFTGYRS